MKLSERVEAFKKSHSGEFPETKKEE